MYKVYRYRDGLPQEVIASFGTLREAYAHAQRVVVSERKPAKAFRILGPLPPSLTAASSSHQPSSGTKPRQYWFVLNGVVPTHGALLTSAVLGRIDGEQSPGKAHEAGEKKDRRAGDSVSRRSATPHSGRLRISPPLRETFRVDREAQGVRQTLWAGFKTQAEAQACVDQLTKGERDPNTTYIIVAPPDIPSDAGRYGKPVGIRSSFLRGAPRLRGYAAGSKRQRERHDWEVEDRKSDATLVSRSDEELGLGIPAQTNKGRRSRKGDYIP